MTVKRKAQVMVDFCMTALLPVLMAYELVGEATHEWAGITMFLLFVAHHILNWKWHKALFKGHYTAIRTLGIVVNIVLFLLMLSLMVSGIVMSRHAFSFLGIYEGSSLARIMHLASSYWCYVLTCVHLGLHGSMLMGMLRKVLPTKRPSKSREIVLRCIASLLAAYGVYAFINRQLGAYMLLQSEFVFFDFSEPLFYFFGDYLAIMGLFVCIGYYTSILLRKISVTDQKQNSPS